MDFHFIDSGGKSTFFITTKKYLSAFIYPQSGGLNLMDLRGQSFMKNQVAGSRVFWWRRNLSIIKA
jgi:hypothetical protein